MRPKSDRQNRYSKAAPTTPEEQRQLDENLLTLAIMLKRDQETDEEAFDRVKKSRHIIHYKHDEYWPFYHVDQRFGKTQFTLSTPPTRSMKSSTSHSPARR